MSFYNTINSTGQDLFCQQTKASSLEQFILSSLKEGEEYSPYDVLELCHTLGRKTKENSVRRALTDLRKQLNKIKFTGNKKVNGKYSPVPNATIQLI